jgi:hypothetical protein
MVAWLLLGVVVVWLALAPVLGAKALAMLAVLVGLTSRR